MCEQAGRLPSCQRGGSALEQQHQQRGLPTMMASIRGGTAVRSKRSGDGREGRLRHERAASMPLGRPKGEGMQASAWRTMSFEKLQNTGNGKGANNNNCSSSTSPETDPGGSSVFPSFAGEYDAYFLAQEREERARTWNILSCCPFGNCVHFHAFSPSRIMTQQLQ